MISNPIASLDGPRSMDVSSSSPLERRTTSSTLSSSNKRYSLTSNETGESSTATSKRDSLATTQLNDGLTDGSTEKNGRLDVSMSDKPVKDGRGSHRSHRSRSSGGFLLSNSVFELPSENVSVPATEHLSSQRSPPRDHKGKGTLRSPEKKHTKRRSNVGAVGSSPLAANVTIAGAGSNGLGGDSTMDKADGADNGTSGAIPTASRLDVDSARIVNLALNLSESRRNAARRIVSTPPSPVAGGMGESLAGGSLRQHLQQQRRASRNLSPKPGRGERTMTASPRIASGQRISSPLQAAFDHPQTDYQYHFSASTLARAEKAKNAIELMAQYRRLLQYVPPLKPQAMERTSTMSPANTAPGSPTTSSFSASRTFSSTVPTTRQLGRQYNPLQYIRNRKVRARERKAIDGEEQGFGDLDKVSSWVKKVSKEASSEDYQAADCLLMPTFSKAAEEAASPHTSPQSTLGKTQAPAPKVKRPRIDWVTNPADMLADVFWLEQEDNKKLIEDSYGRRIFPQSADLKRPMSRRSEELELQTSPGPSVKKETPESDLRIDTKLPEFRSLKSDSEGYLDSTTSRARQKLRDVREAARIHHSHNSSTRERHHLLPSHSRSDFDSSDSDTAHHPRRRRSGTAGSHDGVKDILEKQMMEMLAQEAKESEWGMPRDAEPQRIIQSIESQKPAPKDRLETSKPNFAGHSRSGSLVNKDIRSKRDSHKGSSGRASLEVPGANPRGSLEGLDTTAPNSPETKATEVLNGFIPSIAIDLSPPRSQNTSPTRNPLSRVRSKINPFLDHSRTHSRTHSLTHSRTHSRTPSRGRVAEDETPSLVPQLDSKEHTPESPETPDKRRRSMSPAKKVTSRKTDDSHKSSKAGSLRRGKGGEESSGIRGLFKGNRGPVARVRDFLWEKEPSATFGTSSGFSTDESDIEDLSASQPTVEKKSSRDSSTALQFEDIDYASPQKEIPSYLSEMPIFVSPFEHRGRTGHSQNDEASPEARSSAARHEAREERRRASRAHLLEPPPRIDIQNASPTSSPEFGPVDRFRRDSSVSDLESHRASFPNGVHRADSRLNAILGLPGRHRDSLPVTGLSAFEASQVRPSLESKHQWPISDSGVSVDHGPMTKREIARIRALLLSSGIKAKEISRRAAETKDLRNADETSYADISALAQDEIRPVPKSQEHILAARILSNDIHLSSRLWQASADTFCNTTVENLLERVEGLQSRLSDSLTPMARRAGDEADEVSKDLVTSQTLAVKRLTDKMEQIMRRRRRKFRWLRRGGWVLVEWGLVGVMWYVWFMVMLARIVMGVVRGVVGSARWLLWL
jgi:hypothetical protein